MNLVVVMVLVVALTFYGCSLIRRLRKQSELLRRKMEAWKDFAIAVETAYECRSEVRHAPSYRKAIRQFRAAEKAATLALVRLNKMGEYPDAEACSPFMQYEYEEEHEGEEVSEAGS